MRQIDHNGHQGVEFTATGIPCEMDPEDYFFLEALFTVQAIVIFLFL